MANIGAYEAKTHLPKLLERVQKGERITITRHGQPIAELIPVRKRNAAEIRQAIGELRRIRKRLIRRGRARGAPGDDQSLRDLAHDDHRY